MSGFEIAGVVLGSIPLVISALEHYSDGLSTLRSMHKYEDVFGHIHASFVTSACIYRNSCEELLSPLALSDLELYQLLEEVDGPSWQREDLDLTLRSRLGNNYLPYKSSVKQLNKKIILFGQKLKLSSDFQPPWVTSAGEIDANARNRFFNDPWVRIRGGFKSKNYKQLLSSIEEDIARISNLTSGSITLEPLRLERRRKVNAEYFTGIRHHAQGLYKAFSSHMSSKCTCHGAHEAYLRLDILQEQEIGRVPTFKAVLAFHSPVSGGNALITAQAVEIESENITSTSQSTGGLLVPQVNVHNDHTLRRSWKCITGAPTIDNLCSTIQNGLKLECIGILSSGPARHHIHALELASSSTAHKRVSLRQILELQGSSIPIREKCSLAVTLALAVYYLHNTSWLEETWDINDISVLSQSLSSDQPYISREFPSLGMKNSRNSKVRIIKNSMIFALGVALLEISHGKTLQQLATDDDLESGQRTAYTDYLVAERLAGGMHTRELPNYATATQRCVYCNFEASVFSLDDSDFRERFYQGVVVPLRKDYDYVVSNTAT
ncbi:hypothetical protein OPT61_g4439 [Boeremia exigua]|uniref:Uncharacterized protein n=1 Tax=Boeremia exigua TaxID=749465 RepID=A0ACC2IE92_9PLEO|nr:hypothetical protein OPT61_g4439 [Boeremia exigua]